MTAFFVVRNGDDDKDVRWFIKHLPTTFPSRSISGPPELPELIAASVWINSVESPISVAVRASSTEESNATTKTSTGQAERERWGVWRSSCHTRAIKWNGGFMGCAKTQFSSSPIDVLEKTIPSRSLPVVLSVNNPSCTTVLQQIKKNTCTVLHK